MGVVGGTGGAGGCGSLVDVFAVDVDGVGYKGRAPVTTASVALLETKQLELGLDAVDEAHVDRRVAYWSIGGDGRVVLRREDCESLMDVV